MGVVRISLSQCANLEVLNDYLRGVIMGCICIRRLGKAHLAEILMSTADQHIELHEIVPCLVFMKIVDVDEGMMF